MFAESDDSILLRRSGFGRSRSSRSRVVPVVRQENRRAAAEARILQEAFDAAGQAVFDAMAGLFGSRPCRMSARDYTRGL